ncbi:MAG: aminopeptidase P N-terminal domain-containing protein, partial [Bacteroidales bacterium]|nr:aminopeptidase P N-terminal domain-containing protein [Bacteroidales bacterium]
MFTPQTYSSRRATLIERVRTGNYGSAFSAGPEASGIIIFIGNNDAPQNYRGNEYQFRQESSWIYYFGLKDPGFSAILDIQTGKTVIYADDVDIDDIVWMGPQPSVAERALSCGVGETKRAAEFSKDVLDVVSAGRQVHYLPPSRYCTTLFLCELLGLHSSVVRTSGYKAEGHKGASLELIKAVISMRLVKEQCEIEALDDAAQLGYLAHTATRKAVRTGILEQELVGVFEGTTISFGWGRSFATILSQHGETLHNHIHDKIIEPGKLLI